ncbi:MAG TPA: hypothetical protein VHE61_20590 [Opitutaceae bacterium]|nr:hypothetical protein [Opitutaceae bacterium]
MNQPWEELASAYVLDQLEPEERTAFEARLLEDPKLAALVRELETALAARVRALPQHTPPADLLSRAEARLAAPRPAAAKSPGPLFALRWALFGGLAALLLAGIGFVIFQRVRANGSPRVVIVAALDSSRTRLVEVPVHVSVGNPDARFIELASLAERYWNEPNALPVKLAEADRGERGYAIFDPTSEEGYVAVRDIPALKPGWQYHLWIVDTRSGRVHEAGILPLSTADRGLFFFSVRGVTERVPARLGFCITAEDVAAASSAAHRRVVLGSNPF